jgi:Flp pilus assembly protein TadG
MPSSSRIDLRRHRGGTRRPSRRRESGAAAVEFALVLIPLLLIILGTIDWGYYFYLREVVADAARAGARAGSLVGSLNASSAPSTAQAAASNLLTNLNLKAATFPACTGTPPAGSVCLRIVYPTPSITGFTKLGGVMPPNATAQAAMLIEP